MTGPVLCRIGLWGCLVEAVAIPMSCFEAALENGSKIVRKTVPQCNLTQHRPSLTARL